MNTLLRLLVFLSLAVLLSACSGSRTTTASPPLPPVEASFGQAFDTEKFHSVASMMKTYSTDEISDTIRVAIRGEVNEVCQAKGCWMTIAGGEQADEMMVKFKDYGFFVPKDISGREVGMFGRAYYQITPVDELRHYAEDAGKNDDEIAQITEPKRELRFLAEGVKLFSVEM